MAVLAEKIQVIIERKNQGGFRPKRNIKEIKLLGHLRRPHEERIRYKTTHRRRSSRRRRFHNLLNLLLHVGGKDMQQRPHKLVMVQRAIESQWKAVRHGCVPYVEPGVPYAGKQIIEGCGMGGGGLVVDGVCVDEGEGEATCREASGQVDGGDDMAL